MHRSEEKKKKRERGRGYCAKRNLHPWRWWTGLQPAQQRLSDVFSVQRSDHLCLELPPGTSWEAPARPISQSAGTTPAIKHTIKHPNLARLWVKPSQQNLYEALLASQPFLPNNMETQRLHCLIIMGMLSTRAADYQQGSHHQTHYVVMVQVSFQSQAWGVCGSWYRLLPLLWKPLRYCCQRCCQIWAESWSIGPPQLWWRASAVPDYKLQNRG